MRWKNLLHKIAGWDAFFEIVFVVLLFGVAAVVVTFQNCRGS